jgi:hypothetical protein
MHAGRGRADGLGVEARRAGEHARATGRRHARHALAGIALASAALLALVFSGLPSGVVIAGELALLGALVAIERIGGPVVDRWLQGARGEEHVGALLAELEAEGWLAVHDLDTGRGNIDSVLVGPGGLFAVEVKSYAGRLRPADIRPDHLKQAWAQKRWLERELGTPAEPLLVYSRAYLLGRGVTRSRGVIVMSARMLVGHLRRRAPRLSPAEVRALHAQLASK